MNIHKWYITFIQTVSKQYCNYNNKNIQNLKYIKYRWILKYITDVLLKF